MYVRLYGALARTARHVHLGAGKLGRSIRGRREAAQRWSDWAAARQDGRRRLVWIHAASVGELLTAQPVVRRLLEAEPDLELVITHSSPSLADWPVPSGVARVDFVPWDGVADVTACLEALDPILIAFSRGDLWPLLAVEAARRGVPLAMFAAGVHPASGRLRWPVRQLLKQAHDAIGYAGTLSRGDARRLELLGVPRRVIEITADPRHDYVFERQANGDGLGALQPRSATAKTLVAGSVERSDEAVLLDGYASVLARSPATRLVIVPHEPSTEGADRVSRLAADRGIALETWQVGDGSPGAECVLVTTTGRLADMYSVADLCYVGGGFVRGGLHSVIEPAALSIPVVFGPETSGNPDARALVEQAAGLALPRWGAARALSEAWLRWTEDPLERGEAGRRARAVVRPGGAHMTVKALRLLLGTSRSEARSSPR